MESSTLPNKVEQAVIIAAGRSTANSILTQERTKAMLPVLGKPIVIRVMDRLREAGITNFVVVVGEREGELASYLTSTWVPDCKVQIALQANQRGAANALGCATPYIEGNFILTACEHLVSQQHIFALMSHFSANEFDVLLSAIPGNIAVPPYFPALKAAPEGRVQAVALLSPEIPRAYSGFLLAVCTKRILNHTEISAAHDYEMAQAIQALIESGGQVGAMVAEWNASLVNDLDLLTINRRLLREGRDTHILSEIPGTVRVIPPVRIDPRVSVGHRARLGPNVYLEAGSVIGPDAIISNSIVMRRAEVAPSETIIGQIVMRGRRIIEDPDAGKTRPTRPPGLKEYLDMLNDES